MIIEEFDPIKVNLCLYCFTGERRRQTVFVGIYNGKSGFVSDKGFVSEYRLRMFRQNQQFLAVLLPQLLNGDFVCVVLALSVLFTPSPQRFVEFIE